MSAQEYNAKVSLVSGGFVRGVVTHKSETKGITLRDAVVYDKDGFRSESTVADNGLFIPIANVAWVKSD